jgi:phage terminase large subunit
MATEPTVVILPYKPRNWAKRLHASLCRWAVLVLHRRAGKTTAILNHHVRAALDNTWEAKRLKALLPNITDAEIATLSKRRTYWHVMPSYRQGKLTGAWDTLKEITRGVFGVKTNESEMLVTFANGNKVQIIGADNPDSLRGPGLSGLSLDEYSQIPAAAFGEVLSKALADHVGYCIFSGTIKGYDQLWQTFEAGKDNPEWFTLWQNVDGSLETETGATIEALRRAMEDDRKLVLQGLMTQAEFDQEWYLSPEAAIKGAFYGDQLKAARDQGRICRVPYDPSLPVDTDWDLGIDAMAIWFSQSERSGAVRLIDYLEDVGGGFPAVMKAMRGQEPNPAGDAAIAARNTVRVTYGFGKHWGPHDIETTEISSGLTRRQTAHNMGIDFQVTPRLSVDEGISATQMLMARCWWDEEKCKAGLEALRHYRRKYNNRLGIFTAEPEHDWASHGADAFRGLAVRHQTPREKKKQVTAPPRQWNYT